MQSAKAAVPDKSHLPAGHPPIEWGRIGVLLVNLGTPDATDYSSMRRYLKEFLSDRRVIETNRVLWWFILNFLVLTRRPQAKGRDYDKIWNKERNEGPLRTITRSQAEKLAAGLASAHRSSGNPESSSTGPCATAIRHRLAHRGAAKGRLRANSRDAALSAICRGDDGDGGNDKVFDALKTMRWQPALRIAPPYHDDPVYIEALAASMERDLAALDWKPDSDPRLVSRHPAGIFRQGRSLSLPLREDDAAPARALGSARTNCA
jgi:protoporphyrin/coproporphyrin ferrochelatase